LVQRKWTTSEDSELLRLRKSGKTLAAIAEALGRTRSSVKHRLALLKGNSPLVEKKAPEANRDDNGRFSVTASVLAGYRLAWGAPLVCPRCGRVLRPGDRIVLATWRGGRPVYRHVECRGVMAR